MIYKKHIKEMVKCAHELLAKTKDTQIIYNIYSDSCFILDNEEENVIDIADNEKEAQDICKGINSGEFSEDGIKANCYYKPILIDTYSGEKVTRKNWKQYALPEHINYV